MPDTLNALEADRSRLLEEFLRLGDLRPGSITAVVRRCGKPSCHCARTGDSGHDPEPRQPLSSQFAGGQYQRQHRSFFVGWKLPHRSRAISRTKRRQERNHLLAANHHGESEASHHYARCGDSVSGICLQRRHDDSIQERCVVSEGNAADHTR